MISYLWRYFISYDTFVRKYESTLRKYESTKVPSKVQYKYFRTFVRRYLSSKRGISAYTYVYKGYVFYTHYE